MHLVGFIIRIANDFPIKPKLHLLWTKDTSNELFTEEGWRVLMEYSPLPWHDVLGTSDVLRRAPGSNQTNKTEKKLNNKIK